MRHVCLGEALSGSTRPLPMEQEIRGTATVKMIPRGKNGTQRKMLIWEGVRLSSQPQFSGVCAEEEGFDIGGQEGQRAQKEDEPGAGNERWGSA